MEASRALNSDSRNNESNITSDNKDTTVTEASTKVDEVLP